MKFTNNEGTQKTTPARMLAWAKEIVLRDRAARFPYGKTVQSVAAVMLGSECLKGRPRSINAFKRMVAACPPWVN